MKSTVRGCSCHSRLNNFTQKMLKLVFSLCVLQHLWDSSFFLCSSPAGIRTKKLQDNGIFICEEKLIFYPRVCLLLVYPLSYIPHLHLQRPYLRLMFKQGAKDVHFKKPWSNCVPFHTVTHHYCGLHLILQDGLTSS